MFAQCPTCKSVCYIEVADLRSMHGKIICKHCAIEFDALDSLSEIPAMVPTLSIQYSQSSFLPNELVNFFIRKAKFFWAIGFCICLASLGLQIYYFQSTALAQNTHVRPWLIKLYQSLNHPLPTYKNLLEISVLKGELVHQQDNTLQFTTILVNQASFPQPLPALKLFLVNFSGQIIARRTFYSTDYLPNTNDHLIDSNQSIEISLNIAPVLTPLGGYYFELL